MVRSSRLPDSILCERGRTLCYDLLPWWGFGFSTRYGGILADSTLLAWRLAICSIFASVSVRLGFLVVIEGDVWDE
jgi:hypothetical protein